MTSSGVILSSGDQINANMTYDGDKSGDDPYGYRREQDLHLYVPDQYPLHHR